MKRVVVAILFFFLLTLFGYAQYPFIRIADVVVSQSNQDSIFCEHISGSVKYNPDNKTLTLKDATIDFSPPQYPNYIPYPGIIEIYNSDSIVTIELIGENNIKGDYSMLFHKCSINFKGPGSLYLTEPFDGIYCKKKVPLIQISNNANIIIETESLGSGVGIIGSFDTNNLFAGTLLQIDNSSLTIKNAEIRCLSRIADLHLNKSYISYPENSYFNTNLRRLLDVFGNEVKGDLEIRPGTVNVHSHDENPVKIYGLVSGVKIENANIGTNIEIYDILGNLIYSSIIMQPDFTCSLDRGFYIVKTGNVVKKVVVR